MTPRVTSSLTLSKSIMLTAPSPLPLRKTKSSMVSMSCWLPSRMLCLLQASPRWRPLPIYGICLNHGAALCLLLQPTAKFCPLDVQGWPLSFLGWPLLSRQLWRPPLRLLGHLHHNLPASSSHRPLSHMLSRLLHVTSPLMMSHFQR